MERLLTVQQVAEQLALSRSTVYNLMERGDLIYARIGRTRRIPAEEVDRLIRQALVDRRNNAV